MNTHLLNGHVDELKSKIHSEYFEPIIQGFNLGAFNGKIPPKPITIPELDSRIKHMFNSNGFISNDMIAAFIRLKQYFSEISAELSIERDKKPSLLTRGNRDIATYSLIHLNLIFQYIEEEVKALEKVNQQNNSIKAEAPGSESKKIELIWWTGSDRLLSYLIEQLEKHKLISVKGQINKVIKEHFLNKDKKTFSNSISQNRSGTGNKKPKGSAPIDTLINELKASKE